MRLVAHLDVPAGPVEFALAPGDAVLLAPGTAPVVVAVLRGTERRRGHHIELDGRSLARAATARRVRRGLGFVAAVEPAPDVSVRDHLAAVTSTAGADRLLASVPHLAGRGHEPAGVLSGGERLLLAWLRCVATAPRAVVLDRAGAGLDPAALGWATSVVRTWRTGGVAVVVHASRDEERGWARPGPPPRDGSSSTLRP